MKKNILVGQSGGPTAVINGSLYGVITQAKNNKKDHIGHIYGMINGIEGFLKDQYTDLEQLSDTTLEELKTTPGAYLGSCRFKLPSDLKDPVYARIFQKFNEMNIGYFFYIGGNDSMDTVSKLSRCASAHNTDIQIIGIPKTMTTTLYLLTIHPDLAAPPVLSPQVSGKSALMPPFMIQILSLSWKSWVAMPVGSPEQPPWPANTMVIILYLFIFPKWILRRTVYC